MNFPSIKIKIKLVNTQRKSLLYGISAVLLWSTVATAFKIGLEELSYAQLLFIASTTSFFVFLTVVIGKGKKNKEYIFSKKYFKYSFLQGLFNPFLYYVILFKAYSLLPAHEAQPLNFTWPIILGLLSSIFLKQKLTLPTMLGMIVAFFGVGFIATHGNPFSFKLSNPLGVMLALGSSFIWAFYWIMGLKDTRPTYVKLMCSFFIGSVLSLLYIILFDKLTFSFGKSFVSAIYIGLFEMGITFFLWMKSLALAHDKAKASTLAFLVPFISFIFISAILGETIATSAILGLVLIVAGILIQKYEVFIRRKEYLKS